MDGGFIVSAGRNHVHFYPLGKLLAIPVVILLALIAFAACGGSSDGDSSTSSSRSRDSDRDKIVDRKDKCPKEKEDGGKWSGNATDGCPDTIEDLIELGRSQVDKFWEESFAADGVAYEGPKKFVAYSTPIKTGCGEASLHNAFFCGADHSIYYDIDFFQEELDTNGDYSPVFILAHEWGHLVQGLLDILYDESRYTIQNELQADCFAGVFTRHAEEIGLQPAIIAAAHSDLHCCDIRTDAVRMNFSCSYN